MGWRQKRGSSREKVGVEFFKCMFEERDVVGFEAQEEIDVLKTAILCEGQGKTAFEEIAVVLK